MGATLRTVQRSLLKLQAAGLLAKAKGMEGETYLDPTPLVKRLGELAMTDKDYLVRSRGLVA
jgi:hypothetical protein